MPKLEYYLNRDSKTGSSQPKKDPFHTVKTEMHPRVFPEVSKKYYCLLFQKIRGGGLKY